MRLDSAPFLLLSHAQKGQFGLIRMLEKTTGVVLRALRYKEDSMIVDIYTERHGTVPFLVRVPKSKRSALHTQLLRPLSILEVDYDYRPSQSLQRLKDIRLKVAYTSLMYDPVKLTLSLFLSEFIYHAVRHEASNPALMEFLCMSLQWLDLAEDGIANFHLVFMMQLTSHLGIRPDVEALAGQLLSADMQMHFDLAEGVLREGVSLQPHTIQTEEARFVPLFMRLRYGSMHLLQLTRTQRARALSIVIMYYRLHIPEFPELKSVDILTEVLR